MVQGPITGEETDFPNSPVNGDEFQSPNKFVYKWTDDNRWKNIHRPLVISDYIWPDYEGDPLDPDGGGGDDWTREVLNFPISGSGFSATSITTKTEDGFDIYDGPVTAVYDAFNRGEDIRDWPYQWIQALPQSMGGRLLHQTRGEGSFFYRQVGILDIAPSSRARVGIPVEGLGNPARLADVTFRLTVTCRQVPAAGLSSAGFQNEFYIFGRDASNTGLGSPGGASYDFGTMAKGAIAGPVSIECQFPEDNYANGQRWVVFELSQDPGFEYYDVTVEISDPYGPGDGDFYPVGFSSNTPINRSLVTFESAVGEPPELQSIRHNSPGTLSDSVLEGTVDGTTYLSIAAKATETIPFTAIHCRDGGEAFVGARGDTNVLEYRRLRVPYDITSHSDVVFDATMDYDFTDYASVSPALTGDIKDLYVDPTGFYVYVLLDTSINRYQLGSAWDMSTLDPLTFTTIDVSSFAPQMFTLTVDGNALVLGKAGKLKQIILDTAWTLAGAIDTGFERTFTLNNPVGISISEDNKVLLILDRPEDVSAGYDLISYTKN